MNECLFIGFAEKNSFYLKVDDNIQIFYVPIYRGYKINKLIYRRINNKEFKFVSEEYKPTAKL